MAATIKKITSERPGKCCCCGERWYTMESYIQVFNENGKQRRGERYCTGCVSYAHTNNPDAVDADAQADADEFAYERQREDYAAYQAAGCTSEYWSDRDAGYAH